MILRKIDDWLDKKPDFTIRTIIILGISTSIIVRLIEVIFK